MSGRMLVGRAAEARAAELATGRDVVQTAQSALALLDLSVRKFRDAGLGDVADSLERLVDDATADYSAWLRHVQSQQEVER